MTVRNSNRLKIQSTHSSTLRIQPAHIGSLYVSPVQSHCHVPHPTLLCKTGVAVLCCTIHSPSDSAPLDLYSVLYASGVSVVLRTRSQSCQSPSKAESSAVIPSDLVVSAPGADLQELFQRAFRASACRELEDEMPLASKVLSACH